MSSTTMQPRELVPYPPYTTQNSLHVEVSSEFHHNAAQSHSGELVASAYERGEEDWVGRSPEHISMHLLPTILISNVSLLHIERKRIEYTGNSGTEET